MARSIANVFLTKIKMLLCSNNPKYPPIDVLENDTLTTYGQVVKTIFPEEQNTPKTK